VVVTELHPSKEACDEAIAGSSAEPVVREMHAQLDELLATLSNPS